MKKGDVTADDLRRLNDSVYRTLPRNEALVICPWLRRMEDSSALVPTLQHDSERIVLQDLRARLEGSLADERGNPRLGLSRARALVLGDWLWRMNQSRALEPFLTQAEQSVIWTLEDWLDHALIFEFHGTMQHGEATSEPGYEALVRAARAEVMADRARTN